MATAHRERRRKNLVQFTVAVAADELTEIARAGYPEVHSEDEKRAVEALAASSSPTCSPPQSARATTLRQSQRRFSSGVITAVTPFQSSEIGVGAVPPPVASRPAGGSAPGARS